MLERPVPTVDLTVFGAPAPQGSKDAFRNKYTGRIQQVESSKKVGPWRQDVSAAAQAFIAEYERPRLVPGPGWPDRYDVYDAGLTWTPLDEALVVAMVFTLPKPKSAPKIRRTWPKSAPDCSKLCRSTEDALTTALVWRDDSRVTEYCRLAKVYVDEDPDALRSPGARIRIWTMAAWVGE